MLSQHGLLILKLNGIVHGFNVFASCARPKLVLHVLHTLVPSRTRPLGVVENTLNSVMFFSF